MVTSVGQLQTEVFRSLVSSENYELRGHDKYKNDVRRFQSLTYINLQPEMVASVPSSSCVLK